MVGVAIRIVVVGLVSMACWGCAAGVAERRFEYARVCMGVRATVTLYAVDEGRAEAAAARAFARIGELDDAMSDYRAGSEVMRLCGRAGEAVGVSEDLFKVLTEAARVSEASGGAFDVTMGPAVALWRRARRTGGLPEAREIDGARPLVDWRLVELSKEERTVRLRREGMRLDLGGIAKGYAAERAVEVLRGEGLSRCMVALAGDMYVGDPPPGKEGWLIAIETERSGRRMGAVMLKNAAVSTSGDTEQFVEVGGVRSSHIIDPRTLLGVTTRRCAAVVSRHGAWADALATAVSVLGAEKSREMIGRFAGTGAVVEEGAAEAGGRPGRTVIDPGGVVGSWWR